MNDVIFREYDIRGKVGSELLVEDVYDLARAIALYFKQQNPALKTVAIGMDGRIHSSVICNELTRGFCQSGIDIVLLGTCPTPAVYFSLYTQPVDAGIMVTASHNAKEYNGLKICLGKETIWGKKIQEIKQLYKDKKYLNGSKIGSISDLWIVPLYISWLKNHFSDLQEFPLKVIIDCANGAAGTVLPDLISQMGWPHVSLLYPEVDGNYPHHEADPTVPENMHDLEKALCASQADIGIGFDGDCDRMVPMTKDGNLVSGDTLLAIFAQSVLQGNNGSSIVFDIKGSSSLIEIIKKYGGHPIMSPSGHSIIKDTMQKHTALLAGELSCHFFFKDIYFGYDDGIYALLRLFRILKDTGQSLESLISLVPKKCSSRELRLSIKEEQKLLIITELKNKFEMMQDVSISLLDGIRVELPWGWGLVRPSNTQAALSMRFESATKKDLSTTMHIFKKLLQGFLAPEQQKMFDKEMERACAS